MTQTLVQRITLLTHNIKYYESAIIQLRTECERLYAERKKLSAEHDIEQRQQWKLTKEAQIMGVPIEDYKALLAERRPENGIHSI